MDNTANTKRDPIPLLVAIVLAAVVGALLGGFVAKEQAEDWKKTAEGWEKAAHRWEDQNKMISDKCDLELAAMRAAYANPKPLAN